MVAIELKNISFKYTDDTEAILDDCNFNLEYSKIACLTGPSGCGKSTVLSIISGIIPNIMSGYLEGEIYINGKDIRSLKLADISRDVGIVLQNPDLQIIYQKVDDEIAFACENFAMRAEEIKESIDNSCNLMQLDCNWLTRYLSGGQKQRLMIACTLATKQKILILDEPLANLDTDGANILMESLESLKKQGYAILIIEHRLDMVSKFIDNLYYIQDAKIVESKNIDGYIKAQIATIEKKGINKCTNKILELKNIYYKANKRNILNDISFDIYQGEKLLVIGDNGSGKTSLIRCIARLNKLSSGEIKQNLDKKFGQRRKSKKWFKDVGVVYQNPNYQLFMSTVYDEINFGANDIEFTNKIIADFGLEKLKERHPQSLSEGEKRRVSIAAVIATKPKILLLDEPTVGQDYNRLKDLIEIIEKINKTYNMTIISITHDIRCAKALADRVVWIKNGSVYKIGDDKLIDEYFIK